MFLSLAREDPFYAFNFQVEFLDQNSQKLSIGSFSDVSGIDITTEVEEYEEGGVNEFVHKLPKITKYPNLILKKGIIKSDILYKWYTDVINGKIKTQTISIILLDYTSKKELKKWTFKNAFPLKWSTSDLSATNNSIAIESIEFAHQGLI